MRVAADADAFRPNPADHLHDRGDHRCARDGLQLHAGADAAGRRPDHRHSWNCPLPAAFTGSATSPTAGVQVGKVTAVKLTPNGAEATLSLDTSPKIPANLQAEVRSISAVGEQYVDLRPRTDSPPYLQDGSVIAMRDTTIPQPVGPMLDQVSALVDSIPKDKLDALLDESFKGFNGAGYDLGSLIDSAATVSGDLKPVADRHADPVRGHRAAAGLASRDHRRDQDLGAQPRRSHPAGGRRTTAGPHPAGAGPGALDEVSRLLNQVKPTLPVLLANLTTIGQVAVTYHAVAGATTGAAAAVCCQHSNHIAGTEQPNRASARRLRSHVERSAGMHGRVPAAVVVAITGRYHHDRHARRALLQTAAGFTDRGSRRPQLPLHGPPRKTRADRRDLRQRQAVRTAGDAPACARPLPAGPQPALARHPAR